MAESYSVKAQLSATDNGFSSTLGKASSAVDSLGSKLKGGFGMGILQGMGQKAFSAITSGISGMITEIDSSSAAWKTFGANMEILGKSSSEIESAKKELQSFAEQTVYSSSDMATTYAQLEAVGTKNTASLVKGFGGLAAAAENPQQAMKTLSQQATQMAAKPNVAWADFKLMLEQTPAGIAAVAKEMGMSTSELVKNVQDGTVSTDEFFAAIEKAGTSKAFTKLATQPKTVAQAIDGLKESLANKLLPVWEVVTDYGIKAVDALGSALDGIDADALADTVASAFDTIVDFLGVLKSSFKGVASSVVGALKAIGSALVGTNGEFGKTEALKLFKTVCDAVAGAIKTVANFLKKHAKVIAKVLPWVLKLVLAYKAFKIVKSICPWLTKFAGSLLKMAAGGIKTLAAKLFGVAAGEKATGEAAKTSAKDVLAMGAAVLMISAGVLLIAVGFALMAQSAIALADAGWLAIGVFFGLVVALAALAIGLLAFVKTLAPVAGEAVKVAVAFLLLGAAVVVIAVGFAIMAQASIALAAAGWPAIAVMFGLIAVIAILAIVVATCGTAMIAGAIGFLLFGAALLLCGIGAVLCATSLLILSAALPALCEYGLMGAVAILALGAALIVFAAGALLAGVACIVLAAGLLLVGVALLVVSAAVLLTAVGILLMAAGVMLLNAGLLALSVALMIVTVQMMLVSVTAMLVMVTFTLLMAMTLVLTVTLLALTVALLALTVAMMALMAGALVAGIGIMLFGTFAMVAMVGCFMLAAALLSVASSMESICEDATRAEKAIININDSISIIEAGLKGLGDLCESAMDGIASIFKESAASAKQAGMELAQNYTSGMQMLVVSAPLIAVMAVAAVTQALEGGQESAFQAGTYISIGFAEGMLSCLAVVRSAAEKLAAEADKAVRAKAKIASPSKIADGLGSYWGEGFADGISGMANKTWKAAEELVSIPSLATPDLSMGYSGEMSSEYSYYRDADYRIEVPLTVDGKEFARATAHYSESELNRRNLRDSRRHGIV